MRQHCGEKDMEGIDNTGCEPEKATFETSTVKININDDTGASPEVKRTRYPS